MVPKSSNKKKLNPKLLQDSIPKEPPANAKLNPNDSLSNIVTVSKIPHKPIIRSKVRENVVPLAKTKSEGLIKVEETFPLKKGPQQEKGQSKIDSKPLDETPSSVVKAKCNVKPTQR